MKAHARSTQNHHIVVQKPYGGLDHVLRRYALMLVVVVAAALWTAAVALGS